jgi:2-oxoisovalerate dehydrogenase E1 component
MIFDKFSYDKETYILIYKNLLKPRLIEEKMLILLRQGRISKWFSGIGQEATSVGTALAMQKDEYILPMHRNLGVFTSREMPLFNLFCQFQGKKAGYTKGRDRSFHFGSKEHKIVGMISHLGPQMGLADGIALAHKLKKEEKCTLVFTGDGASSEGDFHEAINVAAVWNLPVIFVIENNGYGLSTPSNEQFKCKQFIDKAIGYGIEGIQVDGNNVLEVYHATRLIADDIRKNPRPVILECMTFRMRGHEEASGTKYVPQELFEIWGRKDPVENYRKFLLEKNIIDEAKDAEITLILKSEISKAVEQAFAEPKIVFNEEEEYQDLYSPFAHTHNAPDFSKTSKKRLIDAIRDGLRQSMEIHTTLILMGQDIAEYGGVFKATDGFVEIFGKERVRNTPLCESAIVGSGLGLSINGMKAMVEMQFADFVTEGFNQIVNNLAKIHWRWGQNADVVVRMPTGAGVAAGPFHSQSNEAWFFHTPGLKIVYPSNPIDAKGLLNEAFNDPNPIIFFEHKALYRSIEADVPDNYYTQPIGKGKYTKRGKKATIITYGMGVHWAETVVNKLNEDIEIIDLMTLLPFDKEIIAESVKKTGRVLLLHEDTLTGGIGAEISAFITENYFNYLDAPVLRCASIDTPVPFAPELETGFLASAKLELQLKKLLQY